MDPSHRSNSIQTLVTIYPLFEKGIFLYFFDTVSSDSERICESVWYPILDGLGNGAVKKGGYMATGGNVWQRMVTYGHVWSRIAMTIHYMYGNVWPPRAIVKL